MTNAVVANCVLFVFAAAVGAVGVPINDGEEIGAAPKFVNALAAVVAPVPPLTIGKILVTPVAKFIGTVEAAAP